jgi:hypothetical protein
MAGVDWLRSTFGSVLTGLSNWANQLILAGVIAAITAIGWAAWGAIKTRIVETIREDLQSEQSRLLVPLKAAMEKQNDVIVHAVALNLTKSGSELALPLRTAMEKQPDVIITAVVNELARDVKNNRLVSPLRRTIESLREFEVGALHVGSFTLTPSNSSYSLFLYFPENYTGKLALSLDGVSGSEKYVVLQPPDCEAIDIQDTEFAVSLEGYLNDTAGCKQKRLPFRDMRPELKELRALTFQLKGTKTDSSDKDHFDPTSRLTVKYVAYIQPAIRLLPAPPNPGR